MNSQNEKLIEINQQRIGTTTAFRKLTQPTELSSHWLTLFRHGAVYLILLLPFLLSACGLASVRESGNITTETRDVSNFNRVVFAGTGKLLLTQSGEESLTVTADDNLLNYIESEVSGRTLFIEVEETWETGLSPSQPIRFNLTVNELAGLEVDGVASAETGEIDTAHLTVNLSGLSTLRMGALQAQELVLNLSGPTEAELTGRGEVNEQKISLNGPSTYLAPELRSQRTDVTINGPAKATVWATDSLSVSVSGKGSVDYYGSPQVTQIGAGIVNISSLGNP